jgi:large subunit ribosomal protein L18
MKAQKRLAATRQRKRWRVRKKIVGTPERPRMSVFRSSRYIYAQMIDDMSGVTLAAATSLHKGVEKGGSNIAAATEVGRKLAEAAKAAGISKAAFDRGQYKFHGRVKALAEAVRAGGIQF